MNDYDNGDVVQSVFAETQVFASPAGEKFAYVHLVCDLGPGKGKVNLLFNPGLTVFLLDAVTRYMGTVFGVPEVGKTLEQAMDEPVDWDSLPPPPEDVVDYDPDQEPDPDWRHDTP
jgi:hypothetical protein